DPANAWGGASISFTDVTGDSAGNAVALGSFCTGAGQYLTFGGRAKLSVDPTNGGCGTYAAKFSNGKLLKATVLDPSLGACGYRGLVTDPMNDVIAGCTPNLLKLSP